VEKMEPLKLREIEGLNYNLLVTKLFEFEFMLDIRNYDLVMWRLFGEGIDLLLTIYISTILLSRENFNETN
jgi:hypothetical protein